MKKSILFLILICFAVLLAGCGTGGAFQTNHSTTVELSEPNYNILAAGVTGTSMQGYILGLSIASGSNIGTFGLARVSGDVMLYDAAVKDILKNFEKEHGETAGRKLALINVRHDAEMLNTFIYTQTDYFITADVIEFIE